MLLTHFFQSKSFNNTIILLNWFLKYNTSFWGIDRGLVINFIFMFFIFFNNKEKLKSFIILLSSILSFWWHNTFSVYKLATFME